MGSPDDIAKILDEVISGEEDGALWRDLAAWAFEEDDDGELVRDIPASDEITPAIATALLDEIGSKIAGLRTSAEWASAARYFQAENFHGLSAPAAMRALDLRAKL
ncbi:MAG TPA: hypothetical protein VGM39_18610 [Kofleriaceae bacterium]|jgi:hypothetical protein